MAWTSTQATQRGYIYQVLLIMLVTVGVATNALPKENGTKTWGVKHFATKSKAVGMVDQHVWEVDSKVVTIKDIHICLETTVLKNDPRVDTDGNGDVSPAEKKAFEADMLDDWKTPSIKNGSDTINWEFSVTWDRTSGKICLNFYGDDPLPPHAPGHTKTFFSLKLKDDANQFENSTQAINVTDAGADVIATNDGTQLTGGEIPDGTIEDVGGPILRTDAGASVRSAEKMSVTWGRIRSSY